MKKKSIIIAISAIVFSSVSLSPAIADDEGSNQDCSFDQVNVCFADGACYCAKRVVELSDPVPEISSCEDPQDTGSCN
jgi:hypothetical protein